MKLFSHLVLLLVIIASLVACGDDTVDPRFDDRDNQRVDPNNIKDPNNGEPIPESWVLSAESQTQFTQEIRETIKLEVLLQTSESHEAVANQQIVFQVMEAPDATFVLEAPSAVTDEAGKAAVTLVVGEKAGRIVVRASQVDTEPVDFIVDVTALSPGGIQVEIFPPAGTVLNFAPYRVRAYPSETVTCQELPARADFPGFTVEELAQGELVVLTNLAAERTFTVFVQALGNSASAIASGCVDNVEVLTLDTTEISVPLNLVPLNPTGTYLVTGFWDISEAIRASGDTGSIVVGLIDFLANPGAFIYDLVITEIEDAVNFDLSFLDLLGVPALVETAINDFIFQDADLQRFRDIGVGLQGLLYNLEVESELVIEKTEADLSFIGYEHWQKLVLDLSWRCDTVANPGCGRYEVAVDRDGNLPGLGSVKYDWTGLVANYDELMLNSHEFTFDYGALLLTIIEQVVLPELTNGNATNLTDAFIYLVDCAGLAQDVAGGALCVGSVCLGEVIVEQACVAAMGTAAEMIINPLENQSVAIDMTFTGAATLFDTGSNGWVDEIRDGLNTGTMVNSNAPVTVEWSAVLTTP